MGTRGAFGVIIGEKEKISYSQFDSYPDGHGVETLGWLRGAIEEEGGLESIQQAALKLRVVDESKKPTAADIEALAPYTSLGVSEQSTDDWYCLTREAHGDLGKILECGYILDSHLFPLDSLFCEWAYIVDLDANVFEVYKGFQKKLPKAGRWKGRPTKAEDTENYKEHLYWCAKNHRDPWQPEKSEYKAVELVASWPFSALPSDEDFLGYFKLLGARELLTMFKDYPDEVAELAEEIAENDLAGEGKVYAAEWKQVAKEASTLLGSKVA